MEVNRLSLYCLHFRESALANLGLGHIGLYSMYSHLRMQMSLRAPIVDFPANPHTV